MRVYIAAARSPPRSEPENSHARLPRAIPRNALSAYPSGEYRGTWGPLLRVRENLLAAIVIYWNTLHLGHAVAQRQSDGLSVPPELDRACERNGVLS